MYIKIRVQWTYNNTHNNHGKYTWLETEISRNIIQYKKN